MIWGEGKSQIFRHCYQTLLNHFLHDVTAKTFPWELPPSNFAISTRIVKFDQTQFQHKVTSNFPQNRTNQTN